MVSNSLPICNPAPAPGVPTYRGQDEGHRQFLDWHRTLGTCYPMCDLDCLVLEYDHRLPVAIMELKSQHWSGYMETANNEAIAALSNRASLPAFVVWLVDPAREKLIVKPLNELARGYIPCDSLMMEHSRYAHLLALLRSGTVEAIDE